MSCKLSTLNTQSQTYIKTLTNKLTTNFTVATKKLNYLTLSLTIALTSILPILLPATATAAPSTPPDSCFDFNSGTGTITDYYDYEADNNSNPACTRELIIPSTLGGNAVTTIGNGAFSNNQLTSVTIPNSVTVIGDGAFQYNQLISVTIPSSVTTIGNWAFQSNQLTSVTIPNSVTTIGDGSFFGNKISTITLPSSSLEIGIQAFFGNELSVVTIPDSVNSVGAMAFAGQVVVGGVGYMDVNNAIVSNDPDLVSISQAAIDSIVVTQIYADDPGALGLTDVLMTEADFGVGDMNNDGDTTDLFSGQLINPARVTATYKDDNGNTIAPSTIATGTGLSTYLAVDNPTNDLSLYYKAGNSYTVPTAPIIAGYTITTTPSNIASLSAGDNQINYVYTANSNNNNNNGGGNNNSNTVDLTTPTSPISAFTLKPVSLTTPTGTTINSSSTVPESSLVTQDNNNQYPLGLVNFSFTTNQSSNQVTLNFETDLKPNQVTPRKYNSNTNTYNNLPTSANPTITETTINNKHHLTLTYTIIDNGELDLDPTTGIIKDPVGLAVSNSTYDQLANTGTNNTLPIATAISMVTIASGIWVLSKRKKSYSSLG